MKVNIRKVMRGLWICLILGTVTGGMSSCSKAEVPVECAVITGWSTVDDGGMQENYFLFLDNGGRQLVDYEIWLRASNGETVCL